MAKKEINFNIKVNNKELDLTKVSFKEFDKIIKDAKKDLQALPLNDPRYKVLNSEIKAADKAWKDAKKSAAEFGGQVQEDDGVVKSYTAQIKEATRELISLETQYGKNSTQAENQRQKIKGLRDEQESLVRSTQKFDDALSNIPGPIGRVGQGLQQLDQITGSATSAFGSLTKMFPILDNAIAASGIGALIVLFGMIVAAVIKAAKSFEPLQQAFASIGDAVATFFDALKPITDFILNVFVAVIDTAAAAIKFFAEALGGTDAGFNKMSLNLEKNIKKQEALLSNYGSFLSKNYSELVNLALDYNKKQKEILDDETKNQAKKLKELLLLAYTYRLQVRDLKNAQNKEFRDLDNKFQNENQKAIIAGYDNERSAAIANSKEDAAQRKREADSERKALNGRIISKMVLIKELQQQDAVANKDAIEALQQSIDDEKKLRDYKTKEELSANGIADAELKKQRRQWAREDVNAVNERNNQILQAGTELIKEENARNLKQAQDALVILKEQHRKEREEVILAGGTLKKLKEKQDAERLVALENVRKAQLQFDANLIQQEIDRNNRLVTETAIGTKEYFDARREVIDKELQQEILLADGNANKIENARTNHWKKLLELDKEGLQAQVDYISKQLDLEYENSINYFNKQRDLEVANYELQKKTYQGNYDMLELLKKQHMKNMNAIDVQQLQYASEFFTRRADTEKKHYKDMFADLEEAETMSYQARLKAAGDNAQEIELIEAEHTQKLKDLQNQKILAYAGVVTTNIDALANLSNALAAFYEFEANNTENSIEDRKRAFETNKKFQIATAVMSAASGIIQILTQPSTLPSPFDWIVKGINAASLAIMTGVQIAKIKSTKFGGDDGGGSGGSGGNNYGRNYEQGGIIGGERHYNGGTMIEAEKGEAIMTRGAVTMFAPMLSMMNQMGGGTSFAPNLMTTSPDAPKSGYPSDAQTEQAIIKTYVVESDLTSSQQRQARLKDLSTL